MEGAGPFAPAVCLSSMAVMDGGLLPVDSHNPVSVNVQKAGGRAAGVQRNGLDRRSKHDMDKVAEDEDEAESDLPAMGGGESEEEASIVAVRCTTEESQELEDAAADALRTFTAPAIEPENPLATEILMLRELELAPVMMHPQQVSRATEIRLFLARIERIAIHEVIERDEGVIYFVLDVYQYRQQKGLPSTRSRRKSSPQPMAHSLLGVSEPSNRVPDYQIEQRYSSFSRLRSNVAHIARKHHPKRKPCAYCRGLLDFLHVTPCKPSLKVKFTTTTEDRKVILGTFINDLVYAARENYASCPRSLRGYHIIPALVKRFLSEQTGANFFS
ncbi:hypothetical protein BBJ28_00001609 [Nothophytophthora sp. Chile5]|nr:hypothetical protein BBJ28_00001609 [Nothophytophthora sp. Chile5]